MFRIPGARRTARGAWLGLLAGALACTPDEPDPAADASWCGGDSADVPVALTPAGAPGAWAEEGLAPPEFVELWRAGGHNEGEELGFPLTAAVSADGRLVIADFLLAEVAVVDADGTWHGRWARPGNGPGEISTPVAAQWSRDGASTAIFDIENARIAFVEDGMPTRSDLRLPHEELARVLSMDGALSWAGVTPGGVALLGPIPARIADPADSETVELRSAILVASPGSEAFDTLLARTTPGLGDARYGAATAPGWPRLTVAVGASGELAAGGQDARYRVRFLAPDGTTTRVVCRDAPPLPLGEREVELPDGVPDARAEAMTRALDAADRDGALAPYGRIFLSREGSLWVQRDRPSALSSDAYHGVPGALYDVFGPDGRYLGEVRAPENARFQAALGDTVWAYEIGELDETWVVAYELRRP